MAKTKKKAKHVHLNDKMDENAIEMMEYYGLSFSELVRWAIAEKYRHFKKENALINSPQIPSS